MAESFSACSSCACVDFSCSTRRARAGCWRRRARRSSAASAARFGFLRSRSSRPARPTAPSVAATTGNVVTLKICPSGSVTSPPRLLIVSARGARRSPDNSPSPQKPTSSHVRPRSAGDRRDRDARRAPRCRAGAAAAVEDSDGVADRVEGLLPFPLAARTNCVQPRVLHGDRDLSGDDRRAAAGPASWKRRGLREPTRQHADAARRRRASARSMRAAHRRARRPAPVEPARAKSSMTTGAPRRERRIARPRHARRARRPTTGGVVGGPTTRSILESAGRSHRAAGSNRRPRPAHARRAGARPRARRRARASGAMLVADLVDRLQLPDQPAVLRGTSGGARARAPPWRTADRSSNGFGTNAKALSSYDWIAGGQRRPVRHHDDLGVGRQLLELRHQRRIAEPQPGARSTTAASNGCPLDVRDGLGRRDSGRTRDRLALRPRARASRRSRDRRRR